MQHTTEPAAGLLSRRHLLRRALAAGLSTPLVMQVLAACGGDDDDGEAATATSAPATPTTGAATSTSAGTGSAATPTSPLTTAPASPTVTDGNATSVRLLPLPPEELGAPAVPAPAASTDSSAMTLADAIAPYQQEYGTDAAPGVFPRTIRHGKGASVLEAQPKRIVALELGSIDTLFELGIKPVGVVDPTPIPFSAEQEAFLDGVPRVASWEELDYEAIIAAQPDLIIADVNREDRLSEIAPTVYLYRAGSGMVWREVFEMTVLAVGAEEQGAAVVQAYEERVRALNAALPNPRPSFSFIRVQAGSMRYMLRSNFAGRILTDVGIPRPAAQNIDAFALLNMSLETLGEYADADVIVIATDAGDAASAFEQELLESAQWQTLAGVQNDRVLIVENATWIGGVGYGGAHGVLDDLAAHFNVSI